MPLLYKKKAALAMANAASHLEIGMTCCLLRPMLPHLREQQAWVVSLEVW